MKGTFRNVVYCIHVQIYVIELIFPIPHCEVFVLFCFVFIIYKVLETPKGVEQSSHKVELSTKTVAKQIFFETENKSYETEASMLKPSEAKTPETLAEEKPAAKPQKRMELAPAKGMLGWA